MVTHLNLSMEITVTFIWKTLRTITVSTGKLDVVNWQSSSTPNLTKEKKKATSFQKENIKIHTPTILLEQVLTPTQTRWYKPDDFSLQQTWNTNKSKEQIALKPNQIKGKVTRYESYKDFLTHCIAEELISKGLETWIRADKWKLWLKVCRQKVFQIQRFSAYTNERHSNL